MGHYRVLYDIGAEHFDWVLAVGPLAVAGFWMLAWPIAMMFKRKDSGRAFATTMMGLVFALVYGVFAAHRYLSFVDLQHRLSAGAVTTTDGVIRNYRGAPIGSHRSDTFQIGDRQFEVQPLMVTSALSTAKELMGTGFTECARVKAVGKDIVWLGVDESGASCPRPS